MQKVIVATPCHRQKQVCAWSPRSPSVPSLAAGVCHLPGPGQVMSKAGEAKHAQMGKLIFLEGHTDNNKVNKQIISDPEK